MILCCGDALVDMLPGKTGSGEAAFVPHAGGASLNTAVALGRLGVPTEFFSGISRDLFGQLLENALENGNVGIKYAIRSDHPTTLAFVGLSNGQANYTFYNENSADRTLSESDLPDLDDDIAALLFGAISLVQEPCGTAYEALMKRECQKRIVVLDPNIRPSFIGDRASHLARMNRMVAMADIIKVSDEDLAWFDAESDVVAIVDRWLDNGTKLIIVTAGVKGSTAYRKGGSSHAEVEPAEVVDTVGAGDTFSAGFLASLQRDGLLTKQTLADADDKSIARALAIGNRAAAITVSRAGANPPWAHEISL